VGSAAISQFFLPVSGIPLPLLVPRCSPRSFTRNLYKGDSGAITVYQFIALPLPPLPHPLCASELLHSPLTVAAVDARKDPCPQEPDGEEQDHQCVDQLGALLVWENQSHQGPERGPHRRRGSSCLPQHRAHPQAPYRLSGDVSRLPLARLILSCP
jgi:hypothetical protein